LHKERALRNSVWDFSTAKSKQNARSTELAPNNNNNNNNNNNWPQQTQSHFQFCYAQLRGSLGGCFMLRSGMKQLSATRSSKEEEEEEA